MGCNCATSEQLNELYRRYGVKKGEYNHKKKITLSYILQKILLLICTILLAPLVFGYVIYKLFSKDRRISVVKFFNLKENNMITNVG